MNLEYFSQVINLVVLYVPMHKSVVFVFTSYFLLNIFHVLYMLKESFHLFIFNTQKKQYAIFQIGRFIKN